MCSSVFASHDIQSGDTPRRDTTLRPHRDLKTKAAGSFGPATFAFDDPCGSPQAARTEPRNFATSDLSRPESADSVWAAENTCEEAAPVSVAPRWTSVMLDETRSVPRAACCTLREISWVAAPCSSMAAAM